MPIAHISLPVADLDASLAFYLDALKPLGYGVFMKIEQTAGLAVKYGGPDFWLHHCPESNEKDEKTISKTHVAFQGSSQKAVDAFYAAALCVTSLSLPCLFYAGDRC
jgi:catechol 2,3-dioxygenase-like lactoylglutathione lyase family enzyme